MALRVHDGIYVVCKNSNGSPAYTIPSASRLIDTRCGSAAPALLCKVSSPSWFLVVSELPIVDAGDSVRFRMRMLGKAEG